MKLQEEVDHRFADLKTNRTTFFADSFSFDVQDAPPVLQVQLIDLQRDSELQPKIMFMTLFCELSEGEYDY